MADQDFILIRYKHPNKGKHRVIGGTTRTDYGRRSGGDTFLVHLEDVRGQSHLFDPIETKKPEPTKAPTPAPTPVVATESGFDLQLLPGVTVALAHKMNNAGFDTPDKIKDAGVEGLVAIKGIGEHKAEQIIEALELLSA